MAAVIAEVGCYLVCALRRRDTQEPGPARRRLPRERPPARPRRPAPRRPPTTQAVREREESEVGDPTPRRQSRSRPSRPTAVDAGRASCHCPPVRLHDRSWYPAFAGASLLALWLVLAALAEVPTLAQALLVGSVTGAMTAWTETLRRNRRRRGQAEQDMGLDYQA